VTKTWSVILLNVNKRQDNKTGKLLHLVGDLFELIITNTAVWYNNTQVVIVDKYMYLTYFVHLFGIITSAFNDRSTGSCICLRLHLSMSHVKYNRYA